MAAPSQSTAQPWCTQADVVLIAGADAVAALPAGLLSRTIQAASDIIYHLTRLRWPGASTDTVRPCGSGPAGWAGHGCTPHGCDCGRPRRSELRLAGIPLLEVQEILVDGEVVPADAYEVRDWQFVDRVDGGVWPCCQDLDRSTTELGTMSVRYRWGVLPADGGVLAAAALAYQLALAYSPAADGECRLPARVTAITRQGVSMAVLDPLTLFAEGQVGLPEVDMWVASVNGGGDRRNGSVIVPELAARRIRRHTTP